MSIKGSPHTHFKRALDLGNLRLVQTIAAELAVVPLDDALTICLLIAQQDDERYERAVVRWVGRFALEANGVTIESPREALDALLCLHDDPKGSQETLAGLCEAHGLRLAPVSQKA